jgi:hypothetical protein
MTTQSFLQIEINAVLACSVKCNFYLFASTFIWCSFYLCPKDETKQLFSDLSFSCQCCRRVDAHHSIKEVSHSLCLGHRRLHGDLIDTYRYVNSLIQICSVPSVPGLQTFRVLMLQFLWFRDFDVIETDKPAQLMFRHPKFTMFCPTGKK